MKISHLKISNFRLLKSLSLDLEKDLSLIIGKNNCGKTSLLSLLDKFLNEKSGKPSFESDDFNLQFQEDLKAYATGKKKAVKGTYLGLSLKLFIDYDEKDDLFPVSNLIMDLHPDNKKIVLLFEYAMDEESFSRFCADYKAFVLVSTGKIKQSIKQRLAAKRLDKAAARLIEAEKIGKIFSVFLDKHHGSYFISDRKTLHYDHLLGKEDEKDFISLKRENIKLDKLINFQVISAKREVSNSGQDHTLSTLSSKYYEIREAQSADSEAIIQFKDTLEETDDHLDGVYPGLFEDVLDTVASLVASGQGSR